MAFFAEMMNGKMVEIESDTVAPIYYNDKCIRVDFLSKISGEIGIIASIPFPRKYGEVKNRNNE